MISDARLALAEIFSPPFRSVLWKSLGLTIALLLIVWLALQALLTWDGSEFGLTAIKN